MYLFYLIMHLLFSGIGRITSLFGLQLNLLGVKQQNAISRGVKRKAFSHTEDQILEPMQWNDNMLVIGGPVHSDFRNRILTAVVSKVHDAGVPVIVLHNGNASLHRSVCALQGAIPVDTANRCYDPFRDQDTNMIVQQLFSTTATKPYSLTAVSRNYVRGICELYLKAFGRRPNLSSLENCTDIGAVPARGAIALLGELNALGSKLSQQDQTSIGNLIRTGQVEEANLHAFLEDLQTQLASIVPARGTSLPDQKYQSIYRTAVRRGILCMDISSITNCEMGASLIFSEFLNPNIGTVYVVMDGLRVGDCPTLRNLMQSDKFQFCVSCADIYNLFSSSQPLGVTQKLQEDIFNPIADRCTMHVNFQQSNSAATLLMNYYGTYRKQMQSSNYGYGNSHGTFAPFSGQRSINGGYSLTEKDDAVWRVDQFTRMSYKDVKVFCRTGGTAQYFEYRMKN